MALTALVVDDEEFDRSAIRRTLRDNGYTVLEAADYWGALSIFRHNQKAIDVLVCDISLPERNGCDLAIAMTSERPQLRVLFVSGHVGAEVCKYYGLDPSDVHFLRKPFAAADLMRHVNSVLASNKPLSVSGGDQSGKVGG